MPNLLLTSVQDRRTISSSTNRTTVLAVAVVAIVGVAATVSALVVVAEQPIRYSGGDFSLLGTAFGYAGVHFSWQVQVLTITLVKRFVGST